MADGLTLINVAIGSLAVMYLFDRSAFGRDVAGALVMLAILLDGVDGRIARMLGSQHRLGKYLDSVSDLVSFGFAPAVMVYAVYYDPDRVGGGLAGELGNYAVVLTGMVMTLFAILRLGRFMTAPSREDAFMGVNLVVPTAFVASFVLAGAPFWLVAVTMIGLSPLLVCDTLYPKYVTRGNAAPGLVVIALGGTYLLRALQREPVVLGHPLGILVGWTAIALAVGYVFIGPFLVRVGRGGPGRDPDG